MFFFFFHASLISCSDTVFERKKTSPRIDRHCYYVIGKQIFSRGKTCHKNKLPKLKT